MKRINTIGLALLAAVGTAAFAAEPAPANAPAHETLHIPKEVPAQVRIESEEQTVIAELKTTQAGTLNLEAVMIIARRVPRGIGRIYTCTGAVKAEFVVEGKTNFTVSADRLVIQPVQTNAPATTGK